MNGAIELFHQAIGLRMVWGTEASGNAKLGTHVLVDLAVDMKINMILFSPRDVMYKNTVISNVSQFDLLC